MSITVELSPAEERRLQRLAEREGIPVSEFALRRLISRIEAGDAENESKSALDWEAFLDSLPARSPAQIDEHLADVEAMRNEWDEKEQKIRQEMERAKSGNEGLGYPR